jgi:hypothetical protein
LLNPARIEHLPYLSQLLILSTFGECQLNLFHDLSISQELSNWVTSCLEAGKEGGKHIDLPLPLENFRDHLTDKLAVRRAEDKDDAVRLAALWSISREPRWGPCIAFWLCLGFIPEWNVNSPQRALIQLMAAKRISSIHDKKRASVIRIGRNEAAAMIAVAKHLSYGPMVWCRPEETPQEITSGLNIPPVIEHLKQFPNDLSDLIMGPRYALNCASNCKRYKLSSRALPESVCGECKTSVGIAVNDEPELYIRLMGCKPTICSYLE